MYVVRDRGVTCDQSERSERSKVSIELWTHANNAVTADVAGRWVVSGTDVHRSVSVLHQTRLCHVQWNLRRATTLQQSAAAGLDSSQAQTGSASHCLRLQRMFTGVSSEDGRNWHSSCYKQHYRVFRTVLTFSSVITLHFTGITGHY